jgi:hypothetical protein
MFVHMFNLYALLLLYIFHPSVQAIHIQINPLNAKLNPICHLLTLLGAHHILHVNSIRVNENHLCKIKLICKKCINLLLTLRGFCVSACARLHMPTYVST